MAREQDIEVRRAIGKNFQNARHKIAGMTQVQVMAAIWHERNPKQKNRISEIESGQTLPDAELFQQLCKLYGVSADYILGFSVEPEIDETAGRVGHIYNGLKEIAGDVIQTFALNLATVSASFIKSMPKPHMMALLDQSKRVVRAFSDSKGVITPAIETSVHELSNLVRDTERQMAVQMRGFELALTDIVDRVDIEDGHTIISDAVDTRPVRYRTSCLPVRNKQKNTSQQALFLTGGDCKAHPLTSVGD